MNAATVLAIIRAAQQPQKMKTELLGRPEKLAFVRIARDPENLGSLV